MIAQIVVGQGSKQIDKFFDYTVPKGLEGNIEIGSRVTVPFGKGNRRTEGYVMGLAEHSAAKKLKSIIAAEEGGRAFDESMAQLIVWMREKYLCTYHDVIRLIIPSGISKRYEEWLTLKNTEGFFSEKYKRIIDAVRENGGSIEINLLMNRLGENISAAIKKLCADGVLERVEKESRTVHDKTVCVAYLSEEVEDAAAVLEELERRRAPVQKKMLEMLISNEIISLADLVRFTGGSYNAIAALRRDGYIKTKEIIVQRSHISQRQIKRLPVPVLSHEQEYAVGRLTEYIEREEYRGFLLHGVTGSGKTEVFMRAIEQTVARGRQAIVLVPEISLTPQMLDRFRARFGERVAVYHSGLSMGEKYDEWKKMRDHKADIALGARSAVFAPFDNIGIIIMDEEHELSYKSDIAPRYDTKEIARFRAAQSNAVMLLASATPDIRSYYGAKNGELELITMKSRVNSRVLPETEIVDMREELAAGNKTVFSRRLAEEIGKNLKRKEQTILFLNRRGFSTFVSCRSCGFVPQCPSCSISLTYHKYTDNLKCHYCGYTVPNYRECPKCKSKYIRYFGGGTQRVEEEIRTLFPEASTLRMDVDTTGGVASHERLLDKFEKEGIDILIGTQMVAKGLDFPNVTLVGVITADTMLNVDDYRSAERTFDLLEQVSGRAGRAEKPGRAVIQTYTPENSAVVLARKHSYVEFYDEEIALRRTMWYPPFCEMTAVLFTGQSETFTERASKLFARYLSEHMPQGLRYKIFGPMPCAISRIKNKYRWRILIKCESAELLTGALSDAREACTRNKNYSEVTVVIDKNPSSMY